MAIVGEKKDVRPLLLKLGMALAFSFAGFLYSHFKRKRIGPPRPPPSSESPDGLRGLQTEPGSNRIAADECVKACVQKENDDDFLIGLSSSSKNGEDQDKFLLPEFKEFMKEFNLVAMNGGISSSQGVEETPESDIVKPIAFRTAENDEYEQEINQLRDMVRGLRERERNLEVQLLEYYGLNEQEETVMELQSRLNLNNTEFQLLNLKIESLQTDKQRLELQLADYPKVVVELEEARARIKLLEHKLRSESEYNWKQILILKQRVENFQDQEYDAANCDPVIQLRIRDLENEAEELRNSNIKLQLENSELSERLESTRILANSVQEHQEQAEEAKKLSSRLRQENEDLMKNIEQLKSDRCADVEELVYLRWLNACLRYEMRNCHYADGRTVAKDLSSTMSPMSEEKAKELILEYANTEGVEEKGIDIMDFDPDPWSSSLAGSSDWDDSSVFNSSATRNSHAKKTKFFSKLRKLILGKDSKEHQHHHDQASLGDKAAASPENLLRTCSSEPRHPKAGVGSRSARFRSELPPTPFRQSLDIHRLKSLNVEDYKEFERARRYSDAGFFHAHKRMFSGGEVVNESPQDATTHKSSLMKYAEALGHSSDEKPSHRKSKSVPLGSC